MGAYLLHHPMHAISINAPILVMRGDIARLGRCTLICTQGEDTIKRSKPFKYAYEKEIVMSAYSLRLVFF